MSPVSAVGQAVGNMVRRQQPQNKPVSKARSHKQQKAFKSSKYVNKTMFNRQPVKLTFLFLLSFLLFLLSNSITDFLLQDLLRGTAQNLLTAYHNKVVTVTKVLMFQTCQKEQFINEMCGQCLKYHASVNGHNP